MFQIKLKILRGEHAKTQCLRKQIGARNSATCPMDVPGAWCHVGRCRFVGVLKNKYFPGLQGIVILAYKKTTSPGTFSIKEKQSPVAPTKLQSPSNYLNGERSTCRISGCTTTSSASSSYDVDSMKTSTIGWDKDKFWLAIFSKEQKSGIGVVLRDNQGSVMASLSWQLP